MFLKRCIFGTLMMPLCSAAVATALLIRAAGGGEDEVAARRNNSPVAVHIGPAEWGENVSGPLCGIYAACAALDMLGVEAHPRDFIAAKYVGRCGGSTPEELARVVEEAGALPHILSRLSAFDLRLARCPMIANVRMSAATNRFNHWVVAVPSSAGVRVFDGLQEPHDITTAEFLGTWSGIGICVTREPAYPLINIWLGRVAVLLGFVLAAVVAVVVPWVAGSAHGGFVGVSKQVCGLCASSLALAVAGNAVFGDLLNHGKGVAVATAPSRTGLYRVGTLDDTKRAAKSPRMLLVDARLEQDYRRGTIPGALNIPVTASLWEIEKHLKVLKRDTPIVVFCQSAMCPYDETVGAELASLGFLDITVCDEGYAEFRKSEDMARSP